MPNSALNTLLASDHATGVWWLNNHAAVSPLAASVRKRGWAFFHLEGKKIERKEQFLNHAAVAMRFPSHFGNNWDALYDCLTDMEWIDAKGYVVYFDHTDAFAAHHESQLETVIELFNDAVDYWRDEGKAFLVLLSGDAAPDNVKRLQL